MKKLTAVEFLVNELTRLGHNFKLYKKEIKQAKELEKQQIVDAFDIADNNYPYGNGYDDGSNYYNKTFNQTES